MNIAEFIISVDNFVWGLPLVIFSLGCGLLFSILLKFPQIRLFRQMIRCSFPTQKTGSGMSAFQALSIAIGGRVGTGNITGTASAIFFGGPGSIFWMCIMALVCSASAYIESSLAQVWKQKAEDGDVGGPSFYMDRGLKARPVGLFYAILSIVFLINFAGLQANAFSSIVTVSFGVAPIAVAAAYSILVAVVILGGAKRVANVADKIVPLMSIAYVAVALVILAVNAAEIPAMISMIVTSAFGTDAVFGGIVGSAVSWGVRRGVFSNEAGLGTGAWVAGCADVSHPAKAGLAQVFSVFICLCICIATGLMILITDCYNVMDESGAFIVEYIKGNYDISATLAVDAMFPGFGVIFISFAMFLFTFTTVMAYFIYLRGAYNYIFGRRAQTVKRVGLAVNIATVVFTFFGPLVSSQAIWSFASALCGILSLVNIACLVFMFKPGVAVLRDYERQLKKGIDPVFIPENCGVQNAQLWHEIIAKNYSKELEAYRAAFPDGCEK